MMWIRVVVSVVMVGAMPGCVAFEIRDELKITNQRLAGLQGQMDTSLETMKRIEGAVTDVQQEVKRSTATVASSDATLKDMQSQMEPIRISLRRVDDELRAMMQVVNKAADKVPFWDLKSDQALPAPQAPTEQTTPQRPTTRSSEPPAVGAR
jgi:hypothetical protein